jgi:hypothetical protein
MADFTASTGFRDLLAAAAAGFNYWVTLHDDTGGFVAGDVYAAGVRGELPTGNGYTRGDKAVTLTHTSGTGGVLDGADAVWTAAGGNIGPASYAALWVSTGTITGAKLVSVKDMAATPQTATDGNTMTYTVVDPITIPTPA